MSRFRASEPLARVSERAATPLVPQFLPGEMLDSKYRIVSLLSFGGMGEVYAAEHMLLSKRVAIKVLRLDLSDAEAMLQRFQIEAVAASAIGHENIVTITDMGTMADGAPFLVMEFLDGCSLESALRRLGRLPCATACDIAGELLAGVAAAHREGIIHRDLKPGNVFLARRAEGRSHVKLLDFGIALLAREDAPQMRLTQTGMVMGTPYYMSPEQVRDETTLTSAVDIYAAGVILYEMICGRPPFDAKNYNLLMHKVLLGTYEAPSLLVAGLPLGLEGVIQRAMSLAPEERFATAGAFAEALLPFASPPGQGLMMPLALETEGTVADADADTSPAPQWSQSDAAQTLRVVSGPRAAKGARATRRYGWIVASMLATMAAAALMLTLSEMSVPAVSSPHAARAGDEAAEERARSSASAGAGSAEVADAGAANDANEDENEKGDASAWLEFEVTPPGARVHVNGDLVSSERTWISDTLSPQRVRVSSRGYVTQERELAERELSRRHVFVLEARERRAPSSRRRKARPQSQRASEAAASEAATRGRIVTEDPYK